MGRPMSTTKTLALVFVAVAAVTSMAATAGAQGVANCIVKGEKSCEPPPTRTATIYRALQGLVHVAGDRNVRRLKRKYGRPAGKAH
jgi:hypothetical protein